MPTIPVTAIKIVNKNMTVMVTLKPIPARCSPISLSLFNNNNIKRTITGVAIAANTCEMIITNTGRPPNIGTTKPRLTVNKAISRLYDNFMFRGRFIRSANSQGARRICGKSEERQDNSFCMCLHSGPAGNSQPQSHILWLGAGKGAPQHSLAFSIR